MNLKNMVSEKSQMQNRARGYTIRFHLYEVLEWAERIYDHGNQKIIASRIRETEIDWKEA